jgi:RNA polymerase sigma-70 factor, ECF subfamily
MNSFTEPSDDELMRAFAGGSKQAFEELMQRHQQALYRFTWRQVGNHTEAADLCQKVFLKVFLKAGTYRGESSFRTWLYRIAINQCKNHFRGRDRQRLDEVDIEDLPPASNLLVDPVQTGQEQRLLRSAVEALPEKQRHTLELRFYQDCTFAEIAEIMGCPVGTAKANYHHAITSLRKRWQGTKP